MLANQYIEHPGEAHDPTVCIGSSRLFANVQHFSISKGEKMVIGNENDQVS